MVVMEFLGKKLNEGDILNIDVTPKLNGWHGDTVECLVLRSKV